MRNWKAEVLVALMIGLMLLLIFSLIQSVRAEDTEGWILCQPDSYVNARWSPSIRSEGIGRLELGDRIRTDGVEKNGYIHCTGLRFESNEGWIHAGYIVWDKPRITEETWTVNAGGRTACRRYVDGPRRCWAKNHSEVTVYAISSEWALTDKGFIKTACIAPKEEGV